MYVVAIHELDTKQINYCHSLIYLLKVVIDELKQRRKENLFFLN